MFKLRFLDKSLLIRLGISMTVRTTMALLGILSSVVVAEKTQGAVAAANQAGSLRMLAYRAGMELGLPHDNPIAGLTLVLEEFESRLDNERLEGALPPAE